MRWFLAGSKIKRYPKTIFINDEEWNVHFMDDLDNDVLGECIPSERIIFIRSGQSAVETLTTFIHELIHAHEFEYDYEIPHEWIDKIDLAVSEILLENADAFIRILK